MYRIGFGIAAVIALTVSAGSAFAVDAAKGKQDFLTYGCYGCHGSVGQGGNAGPKLAPDPLPFETLSTFVRTTSKQMPPYSAKVLSDDALADIYAYLQSQPKAADYKSIPILNQ
jgi:mono/diheme cytochrome c family protein